MAITIGITGAERGAIASLIVIVRITNLDISGVRIRVCVVTVIATTLDRVMAITICVRDKCAFRAASLFVFVTSNTLQAGRVIRDAASAVGAGIIGSAPLQTIAEDTIVTVTDTLAHLGVSV